MKGVEFMNLLRKLYSLIDIIYEKVVTVLGELLLFLIALAIFFEVVSRYFFGVSHGMISENVVIFYILLVFLGIGLVTKEKKNVCVTLFSNIAERNPNDNTRKIYKIILSLAEIFFALILIYTGIISTIIKFKSPTHSIFSYVLPTWIYYLSLPFGMFFVVFYKLKQIKELFAININMKGKEKRR